MFRNELQSRLERIFGLGKTTYLAKAETYEQDTLFIDITYSRSRVSGAKGGREHAKVEGQLVVYSQGDRFPYGFFAKRIEQSPPALTRDLFFFDFDRDIPDSPARLQNIHERRTSFLFLYDSQYDPDRGSITSLTVEEG